jgi:hypothetical protein
MASYDTASVVHLAVDLGCIAAALVYIHMPQQNLEAKLACDAGALAAAAAVQTWEGPDRPSRDCLLIVY